MSVPSPVLPRNNNETKQLQERGGKSRDIRHRGRREHLSRGIRLVACHDARLLQHPKAAARRVDLDRQRHQLENDSQREEDDTCRDQWLHTENETQNKQRPCEVLPDIDDRDERGADPERQISDIVLDRVPALMSGDANSCDRCAVTALIRKIDLLGARIVVVREVSLNPSDLYVVDAGSVKNSLRRLRACETGPRADARILRGGRIHRRRRNRADNCTENNQQPRPVEIQAVAIIAAVIRLNEMHISPPEYVNTRDQSNMY